MGEVGKDTEMSFAVYQLCKAKGYYMYRLHVPCSYKVYALICVMPGAHNEGMEGAQSAYKLN